MSEKEIMIPVRDYEILTLMAEKTGKTVNDIIKETVNDAFDNPENFRKAILKACEEAKKEGLTLEGYLDREMQEILEKLKS